MKHPKVLFLFTFLILILTACAPTLQSAAPTNTTAPTPTFPPTYTAAPTITPLPSATPTTITTPIEGAVYPWPLPPLTDEQIQEIIDCENETWRSNRGITFSQIQIKNPTTACEYALLAISTIENRETLELSPEGKTTAQQALQLNPGILLANQYFFFSFAELEIVAPPPFAESPLESARIEYYWTGSGLPVAFELNITTTGTVIATGTAEKVITLSEDNNSENIVNRWQINQEIYSESFQQLGASLNNLIPITRQGEIKPLEGYDPDWIITLTYEDNTEVTLRTNRSNYITVGGPFQVELDGQSYLLASLEFNNALFDIIVQLDAPLGEPNGYSASSIPSPTLLLQKP